MGNKTVDEIVSEIRKVTVEMAEKTADLEIQKLYMKEEKIQKPILVSQVVSIEVPFFRQHGSCIKLTLECMKNK